MTRWFAPALFVIRRLTMLSAFTLVGLVVLAQLAISLWLVGSADGATTARVIMIVLAIASAYILTAIYLWVRIGMKRMRGTIERIASGDLTVKINFSASNSGDSAELSVVAVA